MKSVDTIARVRRAFHVQGWSLKRISRELHLSRNTIRKILRSDETSFSYERERQPKPKIGPWQDQLDALLNGNHGKPERERLTLIRIYEELHALSRRYDVGRALIRLWAQKAEAGDFDDERVTADLLREYETRIEALERLAGKQALELEFLKRALELAASRRSETPSIITGPPASPSHKDAD